MRLLLGIGLPTELGSAPPAIPGSVNYAVTARAGGTPFRITGINFTGATGVTLGGQACTSVVVVNDSTITAITPALTAGLHDLVVSKLSGPGVPLVNAVEAWDPAIVASNNAWFKAGNSQSLTGALINSLGDNSGAGILATLTSSGAARPTYIAPGGAGINGLADIAWTSAGGGTNLIGNNTLLATTAITSFAIFKTTSTAVGRLWGMQYADYHHELTVNKLDGLIPDGGVGTTNFTVPGNNFARADLGSNDGNPHTLIGTWSQSDNTARLYLDGTIASQTGTNAAVITNAVNDTNAAGCGYRASNGVIYEPFTGNMPEWGTFNTVLSSSDRIKLAIYLASQAGI